MRNNRLIATIGKLMRPLPLFPLQALLARIVSGVAGKRPELFPRLGPHTRTRFLIDVNELPFLLLLTLDPVAPRLCACQRSVAPAAGVRIRGAFMDLFKVLDGRGDSDALFFNREIEVTGDNLATYEFGSRVAKHHFCKTCGIYPFHQTMRKPGHYRLNLGCVEELDATRLPFEVFDGASI